jgi:YtcA family
VTGSHPDRAMVARNERFWKSWALDEPVKQGLAKIIRPLAPLIAAVLGTGMAGCDPVINVAGANFPAWLLCLLVGAAMAGILRLLLIFARLDPYLGPVPIIYTSLAVMLALIVWIIFFNRI